jgi:AcrR family transcriptional regulator
VGVVSSVSDRRRVELILDAASQLFLAPGPGRVSMDDLARDLGMAKKAIYRYFPDKHSLMTAVLDRQFDAVELGRIGAAQLATGRGDAVLRRYVEARIDAVVYQRLDALFRDGHRRGLLSAPPELLGEITRGAVERLLNSQLPRELDDTAADLLRTAVDTILYGAIGPSPRSRPISPRRTRISSAVPCPLRVRPGEGAFADSHAVVGTASRRVHAEFPLAFVEMTLESCPFFFSWAHRATADGLWRRQISEISECVPWPSLLASVHQSGQNSGGVVQHARSVGHDASCAGIDRRDAGPGRAADAYLDFKTGGRDKPSFGDSTPGSGPDQLAQSEPVDLGAVSVAGGVTGEQDEVDIGVRSCRIAGAGTDQQQAHNVVASGSPARDVVDDILDFGRSFGGDHVWFVFWLVVWMFDSVIAVISESLAILAAAV